MKVKIIDGVAINGLHTEPGTLLDLPEGLAKTLIGSRKALAVPGVVVEKATMPMETVEVRSEQPVPEAGNLEQPEEPAITGTSGNRRRTSGK